MNAGMLIFIKAHILSVQFFARSVARHPEKTENLFIVTLRMLICQIQRIRIAEQFHTVGFPRCTHAARTGIGAVVNDNPVIES